MCSEMVPALMFCCLFLQVINYVREKLGLDDEEGSVGPTEPKASEKDPGSQPTVQGTVVEIVCNNEVGTAHLSVQFKGRHD